MLSQLRLDHSVILHGTCRSRFTVDIKIVIFNILHSLCLQCIHAMVSQSIYSPSISSWDVERVYPALFRLLELSFLQISLTSVSRELLGDFGIGPQISNVS